MNAELLSQYADLVGQIKSLEAVRETLVPQVLNELQKEGVSTYSDDKGTFSVTLHRTWEYTEAVDMLEKNLKSVKLGEQETGVAQPKEKSVLRFTPSKE